MAKFSPEIPSLDVYTEEEFVKYLARQGIYPDNDDYSDLKSHLITSYEKRQKYVTSRDYYITLNKVLDNLIEFYLDNLTDPTDDELDTLAEGTGIQENIDDAIQYIKDNIL